MYIIILSFHYLLAYSILNKKYWNTFTRLVSTANSILCVYMVYYETFCPKLLGLFDINYVADQKSLNTLYFFSSYLFVDGCFQLLDELNSSLLLSLLHHFVGGLGIYIIAKMEMGFFLGYYFAMTEISTIFLNLSWFYRKKYILITFYFFFTISRIFTIPFLLDFININSKEISNLIPFHYYMVYYGSYTLISLNLIWFAILTKKLLNLVKE